MFKRGVKSGGAKNTLETINGETTFASALNCAIKDERGSAAVELALVMPALVFLLSGIVDYSAFAYDSMQVSMAAQAGADYVVHYGWNATSAETAVTSATTLSGLSASPTPTSYQACIDGSNNVVASNGSNCETSGDTPGTFVTIQAQAPFTPIISIWSPVMPTTVTGKAVVRIS